MQFKSHTLWLFFLSLCLTLKVQGLEGERTQEPKLEKRPIQHLHHLAKKPLKKLVYYLYTQDFINSLIEIPSSNVSENSTTLSSLYIAGNAPIYNRKNRPCGQCSASFLCLKNSQGIFTDIANYLSVDNGLIVTWFTPSTPINLELDSILHSMVTECIVTCTTKVGVNPFYGQKFNMVVSSDKEKIYFTLRPIKR